MGADMVQAMRMIFLTLLLLTACNNFPQLEDTLDADARDAPYPRLTPVPAEPTPRADGDALYAARIAALQARAADIRRSDIAALQ